ncbi:MAG: hypothetical protein OXE77_01360 [Flavobacteriaceae bacterium]|nr:hypothetical protein [Flavobacteriaceae bacterium]MCY4268406.1 hypothetical protein [Flavobacteriaceae bacterium]MCY4299943.1 hypothetical protein [Flavobacteriaceae bacterium]
MNRLDIEKHKYIIIPRFLSITNEDSFEEDIQSLEKFYSKEDILYCLKNTKEWLNHIVFC